MKTTETTEMTGELLAIFRANSSAQLNKNLADIDSMLDRFPGVMDEQFHLMRRLCVEECNRRNQMRDIWETGTTGYMPKAVR